MLFSPSLNRFYQQEWKSDYESENDWPDDLTEVSDSVFIEFSGVPPQGKTRGVVSGYPAWIDIQPPTTEQLVSEANVKKQQLAVDAEAAIKPLERAKQLGIATEAELELLNEWMRYSVELMRVDTSTAPEIDWPTPPDA